jgi:hypothetical protein
MRQLCLELGEVPVKHARRNTRPIPSVVKDLFEVNRNVPSGLVWRETTRNGKGKKGEMAGSRLTDNKYMVGVKGHGVYYCHRIVYYLETLKDPGSMIVRHMPDGELVLGWQADNAKDEASIPKKASTGYTTGTMYAYEGKAYNLKRLCDTLGMPYSRVYQRLKRLKWDYKLVFESEGFPEVELLQS